MKKILISLSIILSSIFGLSQDSLSYPRLLIENGDTIGVIITLEQAQEIDHDQEILNLLKISKINCDSLDTHYIQIVDGLDRKIGILEVQISKMNEQSVTKDDLILNLRSQIENYEEDIGLCNTQLENKDKIITELKTELKTEKRKRVVAWICAATSTIITIIVIAK